MVPSYYSSPKMRTLCSYAHQHKLLDPIGCLDFSLYMLWFSSVINRLNWGRGNGQVTAHNPKLGPHQMLVTVRIKLELIIRNQTGFKFTVLIFYLSNHLNIV